MKNGDSNYHLERTWSNHVDTADEVVPQCKQIFLFASCDLECVKFKRECFEFL